MARSVFRIGITAVLVALLAAPPARAEYIEGVNDDLPVAPGYATTPGIEKAYRWTALNNFYLSEIRWHSSAVDSGIIRLRIDTGDEPGAVLREVGFSAEGVGWHGAPFAESYPIEAGKTYFVTFHTDNVYTDYNAEGGVELTYYEFWDDFTTWIGPYEEGGARMIRFFGEPYTCTGAETLTVNCKTRPCGSQVKAVMKQGQPGAVVTFSLDALDTVPVEVNTSGRAKHKWCPAAPGAHFVLVVECNVVESTMCP